MKTYIYITYLAAISLCAGMSSCSQNKKTDSMVSYKKGTFGYDLNYLSEKDKLVLLTSENEMVQVIISPGYQGKVFTSTAEGPEGQSLGYLNYEALDSDEINEHMNGYGGENRFWLGPEGGRFSVYFKPGTEQIYDNWYTPKPIDIEKWSVVSFNKSSVSLKKEMEVMNYLGTEFRLRVDRKITLLEPAQISSMLQVPLNNRINTVAYTTENKIINLNDFKWTEETGTICVWMLDMYDTAPNSLTIVPFNTGTEKELGVIATTDYFGEIPADRLKIKDGLLFLKTDGNYRSKLGMNRLRTKSIAGNYDPDAKRLTVSTFSVHENGIYLNQEWDPTKNPLQGDALNAYNDGPLEDGSIMGPFLELESASPGAFIGPNESLIHHHNVFHFVGEESDLTILTEALFGISIRELKNIF